jgi:hypothetical protein
MMWFSLSAGGREAAQIEGRNTTFQFRSGAIARAQHIARIDGASASPGHPKRRNCAGATHRQRSRPGAYGRRSSVGYKCSVCKWALKEVIVMLRKARGLLPRSLGMEVVLMGAPDVPSRRPTTEEWAQLHGISIPLTPPAIEGYEESCPFTARQIATRAVILQGVVAVASEVDPKRVVKWYQDQGIWGAVSPNERELFRDPSSMHEREITGFRWRKEAEWALLWVVSKVEALGLPTRECDTRRLVDEIIPALGSDIEPFLASAELRPPGVLLAEDDRHYDLWCRQFQTRREHIELMPSDLKLGVLYQRQCAFEWLHGIEAWDDVQCDA